MQQASCCIPRALRPVSPASGGMTQKTRGSPPESRSIGMPVGRETIETQIWTSLNHLRAHIAPDHDWRMSEQSPLIAGSVSVADVMSRLRQRRKVFHSEADLQFEFGRTVQELDPAIEIRLERPVRLDASSTYLDMFCIKVDARTAIEFKYFTQRWTSDGLVDSDEFVLRNHAARDLARRNFVRDIKRVEGFTRALAGNGIAILLTNDKALWETPSRAPTTRDRNFHLFEGRQLEGHLVWGHQYENNRSNLDLAGSYTLQWHVHSHIDSPILELRYLAVEAL